MKTCRTHRTLLIGILVLFCQLSAFAQDSLNVTMMGRIYAHWASCEDVAVSGNYAFVAGDGLRVIDISDPTHPSEAGYYLTEDYCYDVILSGDYAYIANNYDGLRIMDISDPINPVETGFCDTPGKAYGVFVQDDYAYVADFTSDLRVIDISDPANPFEVGHCEVLGSPNDVVVSGDYAYVSANGLHIIDITDPANPWEVSFCETPGTGLGVALQGHYAYIADRDYGLQVINISDPENPFITGSYIPNLIFIDAHDVAILGNYAYLAIGGSAYSWNSGILVIDVSNPSNPDCIASCESSFANGVFATGSYAYMAGQSCGLHLIQITDPENPVEVSNCYDSGWVYDVGVSGNIACISDEPAGLRVVDVSDPVNPVEMGIYDTPGELREVVVQDNYAYLAAGTYGLSIVDFSDPANPVETGSCGGLGQVEAVAVEGDYAYALSQGMYIIDVSDPANPVRTGYYPENWFYEADIAVSGDYAYLAIAGGGLQIIDVSDPADPTFTGSCNPGWLRGVAVSGNYAYVTDQFGLWVIDVSNPSAPLEISYCSLPTCTYKVTVSGNYAYVSAEYGGLRVVDISDPRNPVEVGYYDTPGGALGVTVSQGYIYVASGNNFGIYQFTLPDVSISLTPVNPPIQIPSNGGTFDFNIEIANNGTTPSVIDIWTMTTLPNGSEYGPIINVSDFTLNAGQSADRDRTQNIPINAPAGDYTYDAYAGVYPAMILNEDHFEFEKLSVSDGYGVVNDWNCWGEEFGVTDKLSQNIPGKFALYAPYPNPFNASTAISFKLQASSQVELKVFDITGREVESLVSGHWSQGQHSVVWDADGMGSGVYFVRLEAGEFAQTRKILLVK